MHQVVLKPGRDRSLRRRHPWVLSGAVARTEGEPQPGARVRVRSAEGEPLGVGHWSPRSQLRVRMLCFGKDEPGDGWIGERVARAVARRAADPALADTDALRLLNAEGDGLPGLVADRYRDVVVVRIGTAGMDAERDAVLEALREVTGAAAGLERPDIASARREGFEPREGPCWGDPPGVPVAIREGARVYRVDVARGQKTGFYLDQRAARERVQQLADGRRVLDLFSYTGGFSVAAAVGGASAVTLVDSSGDALAAALRHLEALDAPLTVRSERTDAFEFARRGDGEYDLIVVDPPPLARRRADVQRAARAYKDVFLHALRRAAPDAIVLLFSCSHHVGPDLLRKITFGASLDARRPLQVLDELGAPSDHPVSLDHPEGRYLSGLLLRA